MGVTRRVRLVVEIDVIVVDPTFSDEDVLACTPDYFISAFEDAEETNRAYYATHAAGESASYFLELDDLTVYPADAYCGLVAKAAGLDALAALPAAERREFCFAFDPGIEVHSAEGVTYPNG